MNPLAYYNEIDPGCCAWLSNLMDAGLITPGKIDNRSIHDVNPEDVQGYSRCHFFAGIGAWDYALYLAGWEDGRPVWTGSCPCQPFSSAGKGKGKSDERHLWPVWFNLVRECRPVAVFGEQVEAAIRHGWLDLVQSDLESKGYRVGVVCMPACGIGAPHIRQRLWFVADTDNERSQGWERMPECSSEQPVGAGSMASGMADANSAGLQQGQWHDSTARHRDTATTAGGNGRMADTDNDGHHTRDGLREAPEPSEQTGTEGIGEFSGGGDDCTGCPTNGFWGNPDWLFCWDGKWRPVEPGTFPMVNGSSNRLVSGGDTCSAEYAQKTPEARVMRLRGYGNAIVPQVAAELIRAYMDVIRFPYWV